ncbi:MAG: glycosyltransferase family 4 protein [Thiobacillus sp.]|nr:glycosyltransferase family 4 protein [Thiobacillus sp.]
MFGFLREKARLGSIINAVIVSNAPAPYRVPGWRRIAEAADIHLDVIYCTQPHIDTTLDAAAHGFSTHFLTGRYKAMDRRFMHSDMGIWFLLNQLRPDVVITTGFIPTYLFAFAWAVMHRVPHVAMTDGTAQSEKSLSWLHRIVRRIVFARSAAFVGACEGSRDLYREYGVPEDRIYTSQLCADNDRFSRPGSVTPVDFIFCGRFMESKRPLFAMQVAREVAIRLGRRTSIDFVGSGEMESEMHDYAAQISDYVDIRFHGYVTQAELPTHYADARIFLFPTEADVWGVVANEACAAGLPVIVSPHAGVAGELVLDGHNGYVRELNVAQWAEAGVSLLKNEAQYSHFSESSRARVAEYTFSHAAHGLANAIRQARPVRKVFIIQAVAKQYRRPFFDFLHARLQAEGVTLTVLYSDPNRLEAERKDAVDLPIAYGHKVRAYWSRDYRMVYQPCLGRAMSADLVIVEQASKHVLNYMLGMMRAFGLVRMAYWGHGRNWQQDGTPWLEPVKYLLLSRSDWWFAYTSRVAQYVVDSSFPPDRVTVVQNSIDVTAFGKDVETIDAGQKLALHKRLGILPEAPIGLFCGSMHASKKLGFLVESAIRIHAEVPDFHLILIGAGPDEFIARQAAATHDWIHYTGPLFGTDKAAHFAIADLFLCPGLVGLAVLEAFAAGLPLFTTNIPMHSPEIDYLTDSVTGAITDFAPEKFAEAVSGCLHDPVSLARMSAAARDASRDYGLEPMVENFAQGVLACLNQS